MQIFNAEIMCYLFQETIFKYDLKKENTNKVFVALYFKFKMNIYEKQI